VWRLVREEVDATTVGWNVTSTSVRALSGWQTLCITGRREDAIEVDIGGSGDQISRALLADLQPVDLLEAARAVGEEALPRLRFGGVGERAFLLPGSAVRLYRRIRQGIEPIFGGSSTLVYRLVAGALPLLVHVSVTVDVAVWRAVELGRVGFEGMGAELLDIDGDRRGQALCEQHVEPWRRAIGQPMPLSVLAGK
jgi:hypothetical protein